MCGWVGVCVVVVLFVCNFSVIIDRGCCGKVGMGFE